MNREGSRLLGFAGRRRDKWRAVQRFVASQQLELPIRTMEPGRFTIIATQPTPPDSTDKIRNVRRELMDDFASVVQLELDSKVAA